MWNRLRRESSRLHDISVFNYLEGHLYQSPQWLYLFTLLQWGGRHLFSLHSYHCFYLCFYLVILLKQCLMQTRQAPYISKTYLDAPTSTSQQFMPPCLPFTIVLSYYKTFLYLFVSLCASLFLFPLSVCICFGGGPKSFEFPGVAVRGGCQLPDVEALVTKLKFSGRVADALSGWVISLGSLFPHQIEIVWRWCRPIFPYTR